MQLIPCPMCWIIEAADFWPDVWDVGPFLGLLFLLFMETKYKNFFNFAQIKIKIHLLIKLNEKKLA